MYIMPTIKKALKVADDEDYNKVSQLKNMLEKTSHYNSMITDTK